MMGRRSNIILCDEQMRVVDAVRRTDAADAVRVLMPGVRYRLPPAQDKVDPIFRPNGTALGTASPLPGDGAFQGVAGAFAGGLPSSVPRTGPRGVSGTASAGGKSWSRTTGSA